MCKEQWPVFTFLWLFITFYLLLDIKHLFLFLFTYIIESEIGEHMKIAVCEDNEADLLVLRQELEIYFSSRLMGQGSVMYYCFSNGEDFLADSEGFKYDLIVLDIYMDFMNGMDVARCIRKENRLVTIVFITNSDDYALEGYEVEASGYLMKPIDREKLFLMLDRIFSSAVKEGAIRFSCKRQIVELDMEKIMFIESMGRTLLIHCCDGELYKTNEKLDDMEKRMSNQNFLRCHKSYLVNMGYINKIGNGCFFLSNGVRVSIRQRDAGYIVRLYERFVLDKTLKGML